MDENKRIRVSVKALIISDVRVLLMQGRDENGDWYLLPGGGARHGETMHEALRRECREEIDSEIEIGELRFVRDYIGKNHEFAEFDGSAHQIELMFECRVPGDYSPRQGDSPDSNQVGTAWLPLADLESRRIYPAGLKHLLKNGLPTGGPAYLGDVN